MIETNFRREPIRSRKLLDSARGQPCTFEFPGVCNHDPSTVVSCHIKDETFGGGQKADDCSTAHGCFACHAYLDQGHWLGRISEADMLRIVLRAIQRTMRNRILRGFLKADMDKAAPASQRPAKPRKPKDLRTPVGPSLPLKSASNWAPKGSRKIPSRPMKGPGQ